VDERPCFVRRIRKTFNFIQLSYTYIEALMQASCLNNKCQTKIPDHLFQSDPLQTDSGSIQLRFGRSTTRDFPGSRSGGSRRNLGIRKSGFQLGNPSSILRSEWKTRSNTSNSNLLVALKEASWLNFENSSVKSKVNTKVGLCPKHMYYFLLNVQRGNASFVGKLIGM
jgi:hypothetical protein